MDVEVAAPICQAYNRAYPASSVGAPVMPDLSPFSLAVIAVIAFAAGAAKVAFGVGSGALLTPVAALVLPAKTAVALMAPLMMVTDFVAIPRYWRKWSGRHVLVVIPTAFVGIILGTVFLTWASPLWVKRAIGVVALLFVATQMWRRTRSFGASRTKVPDSLGYVAGLFAGVTSGIAHAGGIVISIYFIESGLTKQVFVASVIATLFLTDVTKMISYWQSGVLTWPVLVTGLLLSPAMLLGGSAGAWLSQRMTVSQFTTFLMFLLGISGFLLLVSN